MSIYRYSQNFFMFLFISVSVSAKEISYDTFIANNVENVQKIEQGMTIEKVEEIMGSDHFVYSGTRYNNPWKVEKSGNYVQYWYQTMRHRKFQSIKERICTAVTFKDGKVSSIATFRDAPSITEISNQSKQASDTTKTTEKLELLKSLYDQGVIDEKAYKEQVDKILDEM